jgi:hypothetical protein
MTSSAPARSPTAAHRPSRRLGLRATAWAGAFVGVLAAGLPAHSSPLSATGSGAVAGGNVAAAVAVAPPPPAAPAAPPEPLKELPRGGRAIFPTYRLVGFCGTPGGPELGELQGNLPVKAKALEAKAAQYVDDREVLPVFELIAVVVQGYPGPDGKYRRRVDHSVVDQYLALARKSKGLLLLNIQPGWSDFMSEVQAYEPYLHEPDVGIALDPEWAMKPKQAPGRFWGQTTGQVINDVAQLLSDIVQKDHLPEKALVFHEVIRAVVKDEKVVQPYPGVAVIKSVDGLGPMGAKINTYTNLMEVMTAGVHPGFKLFFDEDTRNGSHLMGPKQVLALTPKPEYVMYE